jgi:hypothetical protein
MFISYIFLQKKESHNFITETTSLYGWFLSIQARKSYKKKPSNVPEMCYLQVPLSPELRLHS